MVNRTTRWIGLSISTLIALGMLALGVRSFFAPPPVDAVAVDAAFVPVEATRDTPAPGQAPTAKPESEAADAAEPSDEAEDTEESEDDVPAEQPIARAEPDPPRKTTAPRRATTRKPKREQWKPAVLQIVTNFGKADVTVNGLKYPEYFEPGQPEGMVLPAGGPYHVVVSFDGKSKEYYVDLYPHETRLLLVELSGYQSGAPPPPAPTKKAQAPKKQEPQKKQKPDPKAPGRITVYAKPAGTVIVDGNNTGEKTPGTVELENGRHEVQVQYESGSVSEKKIVRVRTGSRIKLFFRERK